jgi:hypothetical protein
VGRLAVGFGVVKRLFISGVFVDIAERMETTTAYPVRNYAAKVRERISTGLGVTNNSSVVDKPDPQI